MKDSLDNFFNMLKVDRKNSSWSRDDNFKKRVEQLASEVEEMKEALEKDDMKNFKEEMGDALWDLLFLFVLAEEKDIVAKDIVEGSIEKLKRRKPWIFNGENISIEEELKRWKVAKDREKNQEIKEKI